MATFSIQFYTIDCPPNTLDKGDPADGTTQYACSPLTWIDGLHATVSLDFTNAIEGANYCKISTDSRTLYCYKRDFSLGTAGRMTVSLELDPLMTNKAQILGCSGVIDTTTKESDWERYMVGDRLVYAFSVNKGDNYERAMLDFDDNHNDNYWVFCGIYG